MKGQMPNAATLAAMPETEDILAGCVRTKEYTSARELFDDIDVEDEE